MKLHQGQRDDDLPVAVLRATHDLRQGRANAAWRSLALPLDPNADGEGWLSMFHPSARRRIRRLLQAVASSEGSRSVQVRGNVEDRWLEVHVAPDGPGGDVVVVALDVTEQKRREELLSFDATHDPLTGLHNRAALLEHTRRALDRLARRPSVLAVLYLDLDGFNVVNNRHGHEAGNAVLSAVAQRLRLALRPADLLARTGGDEFVALCERISEPGQAREVARRLVGSLQQPIRIQGLPQMRLGVSAGIAFASQSHLDAVSVINAADQAMYQAKQMRPPRIHLEAAPAALRDLPRESPSIEREREAVAALARMEGDMARDWAEAIAAMDEEAADRWRSAGHHLGRAIAALTDRPQGASADPDRAASASPPIG
ncbi:MAG TPA: diguanylate cyclase [Actinomycetota bacterium]|jgi:diguanylate cyclase (GGDEF)-like protein